LPSRPQPSPSSTSTAAAAAAAVASSLLSPSSRIDDLALYADADPYADSVHSSTPSSHEATPGPGAFETDPTAAAGAAHHYYHHHHHHHRYHDDGLGYGLQSVMGYAYGVGVGVGAGFAGQDAQVQAQASGQGMYERAMEAQRRAQGEMEMEMDLPLSPSLWTASRSRTRPRRTGAPAHGQSGIEVATWGSITAGNWKSRGSDLQREGMEGKKHLAAS